jgi:hypothetical protein
MDDPRPPAAAPATPSAPAADLSGWETAHDGPAVTVG